MHLVSKFIKKREYFYLVEKQRRGKRVVTSRQIYIGNRKRLVQVIQAASSLVFPKSFSAQQIGASLCLVQVAEDLHIEDLIDAQVPSREGAVPLGRRLLVAAIHRALVSKNENGKCNLRRFYSASALSELLPLPASSIDGRRLWESLAGLTASQIEKIECAIVEQAIESENLGLESLAFDATNFDSYVAATTRSRLLRRGKAKSGRPLRVLGLGVLVTEDEGVPLLTFTYPGNQNDVTTFGRFLRALDRRKDVLRLPVEATIAADGGNISKRILRRLEKQKRHYVIRLPINHATDLKRAPSSQLPELKSFPKGGVRAAIYKCKVYGKERTVVDVYSERMHKRQLPGIHRDRKKAIADLLDLQRQLHRQGQGLRKAKPITLASLKRRARKAVSREHMADLIALRFDKGETAPRLQFEQVPETWKRLQSHVLGRTLLVTDHKEWSAERVVKASRIQSHNESLNRDLKDPEGVSMIPLRHRRDKLLRANALVVILGLLLVTVLKRRLKLAGIKTGTVATLLRTLKGVQRARVTLDDQAPPALRTFARTAWVPSERSTRQAAILHALKIETDKRLGTTLLESLTRSTRAKALSGS